MRAALFRIRNILLAVILLCFVSATHALAHKVNVFAYAEGGQIMVEAYFADGKPVENAKITVISATGRKLFETTGGKDGTAAFPIPERDDLTIEVDASLGHKASFLLKKGDL